MKLTALNKSVLLLSLSIISAGIFSADCAAQYSRGRNLRGNEGLTNEKRTNPALERRLTEGAEVAQNVDADLAVILKCVNEGRKPSTDDMKLAEESSMNARRYSMVYSNEWQSRAKLLSSWLYYYKDDMAGALRDARDAYNKDKENTDTEATYATMAILSGTRLPTAMVREALPAREMDTDPRSGRGGRTGTGYQDESMQRGSLRNRRTQNYQQPATIQNSKITIQPKTTNVLNFDLETIDPDLIGMKMQPIQTTTLKYKPEGETLCAILWQIESATETEEQIDDPRDARRMRSTLPTRDTATEDLRRSRTERTSRTQNEDTYGGTARMRNRDSMDMYDQPPTNTNRRGERTYDGPPANARERGRADMYDGYREDPYTGRTAQPAQREVSVPQNPYDREMELFNKLYLSYSTKPGIRFVGINMNDPAAKNDVVKKITEKKWPWAQVMSAENPTIATLFARVEIEPAKPVVAIAAGDGAIKYAGTAEGFLPMMLLETLHGEPIPLPETVSDANEPGMPVISTGVTDPNALKTNTAIPQKEKGPEKFKVELGQPITAPPAKTGMKTTEPDPDDDMTNPDNYQADKLVKAAEDYRKLAQRSPLSYKQCIKFCRQVMKEYPDTKYYIEAQKILQKIPERYRGDLTKEELGY